ncbi:MAG TPA: ATP-binding protein, partial [Candidatus Acidoferrales bacterium]|nr:ATP-binding protein [Candidatus Acidoferrales bacterium]
MPIGDALYLKPKMGIVPEVSAQTYETIAKQFREVISNSIDAGAKKVTISINAISEEPYILISDNGNGMSIDELKEQYLALGGSQKFYDDNKIGRIGIGFLAVAPLCKYVEISSRKKGSSKAFVAKLELNSLMDKGLRLQEIKDFKVGSIIHEIENADEMGLEPQFTDIYLKGATRAVMETFQDPALFQKFKDELRKILPLPFPEDCRLFNHISKDLRQALIKETNKTKIEVFLNSEKPLSRRVYGDKENENFEFVQELLYEQCSGVKVLGYLVDNQGKISDWDGIVTRVLNVAVEDHGFLGYEGHESARSRVMGELFLIGLDKNKAISINRNKFNEGNDQYRKVQAFIHMRLRAFFQPHYKRSNIKSDLNKQIKQIKNIPVAVKLAERGLSSLPTKIQYSKPLASQKVVDLSDIGLTQKYGDIKTTIVNDLDNKKLEGQGFDVKWRGKNGTDAEVLIDKKIVDSAKAVALIDGQKFQVVFVRAGDNDRPCSIDFEKRQILLNALNPLIIDRDEKMMLFVMLTTFCYEQTKNKEEFYEKLIRSL